MKYVDLKFKPSAQRYIIVTYQLESSHSLRDAANLVAQYASFGEMRKTDKSITSAQFKRYAPRVFEIRAAKKEVRIAYPVILFEKNSITHLLSMIMGSLLTVPGLRKALVVDLSFPKAYIKSFQGPTFGIAGIREYLGVHKRALTVCTIKPTLGLSVAGTVKEAQRLWHSGVDIIREDERLADVPFNKFYVRVRKILKMKREVEAETGTKKLYLFNVTGTPDKIFERSDFIKKVGGHAVMVDVVATGIDNIQMLRKSNIGIMIHGHRAAYGMLTQDKKFGMSLSVHLLLMRLAGVDQIHLGDDVDFTSITKPYAKKLDKIFNEELHLGVLTQKYEKINTVLPIITVPEDDSVRPVISQRLNDDVGFMCT